MSVPVSLRSVQHHVRAATEMDSRDPVVAFYCRLYAFQVGMKVDNKSPDCRKFLLAMMDQLEKAKQTLSGCESISSEVVGQAHVENFALKVFLFADNEDRAGRFNKNVVKSFYTASLLFDVLTVFGELTDEVVRHRKYARWKAAHIHTCLKNGETPTPGPGGEDDGDDDGDHGEDGDEELGATGGAAAGSQSAYGWRGENPDRNLGENQDKSGMSEKSGIPGPGTLAPANTPANTPHGSQPLDPNADSRQTQSGVRLTAEDLTRAQKLCKFAGSALQYEDVTTAIDNLTKALRLLTNGRE